MKRCQLCFLAPCYLLLGCGDGDTRESAAAPTSALTAPQGFPALIAPQDNLPTAARVALGRRLFYDERLSSTGEVACGNCHVQANAFADPNRVSIGVEGREGTRNAPGLINAAWGNSFFWDGRSATLEEQAAQPIQNPLEMDTTLEDVTARLRKDAQLVGEFQTAYAGPPSADTITKALASFVRSLISGQSRYDAYLAGDRRALSAAERRGEELFRGERGECFHCHVGYNLTSQAFRNNGIAADDPDAGRAEITHKSNDLGKFKTPTLRNVGVTAPYMQDGSLLTLEAVVDQYDAGGRGHANTDPLIQPLGLSVEEKADLVSFLKALTDETFLDNPDFADPDAR
ncbi:MAG TPA: cytochrome c peroxidase [Polyangiaceae bacterium]|nr:cytochrome c peroxidase [Polyangiaceae bacterium]